jgi:two-component system response regulator VicR
LLTHIFSKAGAQVFTAKDGQEGLRQFQRCQPHLVILDIMMPGMDGWETCPLFRHLSDTPVIFLTALARESDLVRGLGLGAVDYVTKPFTPSVLLARARAALRQARRSAETLKSSTYDDGYLTIDLVERRVLVRGKLVKLTATEHRLLIYLFQNAGQVMTYQQILKQVWGWEYQDDRKSVHVYIRQLRKKLEKTPGRPTYLLTHRGVGYRFERQSLEPQQ